VAQRPAERVPGAQAVDHLDRHRRHLDRGVVVPGQHTLGSLLDHHDLDPAVAQGLGGRPRLALAHGGVALVQVAHGHADVLQGPLHPGPGLLPGGPEHRPVVQVEDGDARLGPGLEGVEGGAAARLLGEAGDRHPEDPGRPDRLHIQFLGADLEVGGLGEAVEVEGEVVRREDLAEGDRGRQAGHGGHEAVVDPEAAQGVVQVLAEGVLAGAGDDRAAPAVAGRGHGHVGRAAAQVLAEGLDLAQRDPDLEGVHVDPDPPHRQDVESRVAVAEHQDATGMACLPPCC
jgi:hypothetical protein